MSGPKVESSLRVPPRERILEAATELFYRHGIRAVGVETIAEVAGTNKMTLYRHFPSKDVLIAEYLRKVAHDVEAVWAKLETAYPGDPRAQLAAWLRRMGDHLANPDQRGCAFCNAAVELPEKDHPARPVIEAFRRAQRAQLARLCRAVGAGEPELLAEELFMLLDGAHISVQSTGRDGIGRRFEQMAEATIAGRLAGDAQAGLATAIEHAPAAAAN